MDWTKVTRYGLCLTTRDQEFLDLWSSLKCVWFHSRDVPFSLKCLNSDSLHICTFLHPTAPFYIGITRHPSVPAEVASLKARRMKKKLESFHEISGNRRDVLDLL